MDIRSLSGADRDTMEDVGRIILLNHPLSVTKLFERGAEVEVIHWVEDTRFRRGLSRRWSHYDIYPPYTKEVTKESCRGADGEAKCDLTVRWSSNTKRHIAGCGLIGGIKRRSEGSETSNTYLLTGCSKTCIQFSDKSVRCVITLVKRNGCKSPINVQAVL